MGKKSKTPAAPNFTQIAKDQAAMSKDAWNDQLQANRPNQNGPTGSVNWTKDANGNWTQNVTLSDKQNQILQGQQNNQLGMQGLAGQAINGYDASQVDLSGAPKMPEVGGYNEQVIDTLRKLQAPDLAARRQAQEAKMAAMGMGSGTGAASSSMQQDINDAESRADLNAILAGIDQGNTQFNQGMALHQQGVSNILNQKQANMAQLGGLLAGSGSAMTTPDLPGFSQGGSWASPDLTEAAKLQYQAALDKANAQNADRGGLLGTLGKIGGSFFGPLGTAAGGVLGEKVGGFLGGK